MSTVTTKKLMSAEEFYDWVRQPENVNRWFELARGNLIELSAPMKPHGFVCATVADLLGNYVFQRGKGYITTNDAGVILERDPDTVRRPDVALYEDADRIADLPPRYAEVPPRLVVEVLSPNDRAIQFMPKIPEYLTSGVGMVWVLDPESRTVTVFRPGGPQIELNESQEVSGGDILPGLRRPPRGRVSQGGYSPGVGRGPRSLRRDRLPRRPGRLCRRTGPGVDR
jgi:Uma2 family endonuclease